MCYSGRCRWEGYMGDCAFPTFKKIRDKYPLPLCDISDDEEDTEENLKKYEEQKLDVLKMVEEIKADNQFKLKNEIL